METWFYPGRMKKENHEGQMDSVDQSRSIICYRCTFAFVF